MPRAEVAVSVPATNQLLHICRTELHEVAEFVVFEGVHESINISNSICLRKLADSVVDDPGGSFAGDMPRSNVRRSSAFARALLDEEDLLEGRQGPQVVGDHRLEAVGRLADLQHGG